MAISSSTAVLPLLVLIITILLSSVLSSSSSSSSRLQNKNSRFGKLGGFTASLIHSDNPDSPLFNPTLSQSDRINTAVQRDRARLRYLTNGIVTPNEQQSRVVPDGAEYVMNFSIGSPPVTTFAIVDTASDLIWLQCLPCTECHKQKIPIFDPSKSDSYENIKCEDHRCGLTSGSICNSTSNTCGYSISYGDTSHSQGDLALEMLTFSDSQSGQIGLSNMIFGCGHDNKQIPVEAVNPPGIVGLNRQPLSFISQLWIKHFSYCFVEKNTNNQSLMHFMSEAILFGGKTPILDVQGVEEPDAFYYLNLQGISVGHNRLLLPNGFFNVTSNGEGGFVIDSGTAFTEIKKEAFDIMKGEVKRLTTNLTAGVDPSGHFELCYKTTVDVVKNAAPDLTFHFSGLDLVLNKEGNWMDVGEGNVCLAMIPAFSSLSVFGNYQQQNMNVGYDLENKVISFLKMDTCNGY